MKLGPFFKYVFWSMALGLFLTGVVTWILQKWFLVESPAGLQPEPAMATFLHAHSIIGLGFLILFGYLLPSHVGPGLMLREKVRSGLLVLGLIFVLILTVPALFYLTDDGVRAQVGVFHTYLGLVIFVPMFIHVLIQ